MIFLDGNLKGKTTAEQGGLILQDVPTGNREVKAVKDGSSPKTNPITKKIYLELIDKCKENYTFIKASAASLWVSDFLKKSKYKKNNIIYGHTK